MIGFPKPEARKRAKARKDRRDAKNLKAFRAIVWAREKAKSTEPVFQLAMCQHCGTVVFEPELGLSPVGEVHHRIGRRDKAHRYDPDNGVLLCGVFGNDCHGRATRHEIEV